MMHLHILGCHSATPKTNLHPTAQVLDFNGELCLIDCGEGTQVRLRQQKIKFTRIKHIFISHLHGDHCYGLIGLISTFGLLKREADLHIYGPKGIKKFINIQLELSKTYTSYQIIFHELTSTEAEIILEHDKFSVETIPLEHRIYTNGFLFRGKTRDRKLRIDLVEDFGIDVAYYKSIKKGKDIKLDDGTLVKNERLTEPPNPPNSYAYCSDTAFKPSLVEQLNQVEVLYHESTFLEKDEDLCFKTKHSTAKQAAIIAQKAQVKHLILGHFSARYRDENAYKVEAESIFKPTYLAKSGQCFSFE